MATAALLLLAGTGSALAQGQESVAAPMGPQTTAHPPPLLSSIAAVSVGMSRPMLSMVGGAAVGDVRRRAASEQSACWL